MNVCVTAYIRWLFNSLPVHACTFYVISLATLCNLLRPLILYTMLSSTSVYAYLSQSPAPVQCPEYALTSSLPFVQWCDLSGGTWTQLYEKRGMASDDQLPNETQRPFHLRICLWAPTCIVNRKITSKHFILISFEMIDGRECVAGKRFGCSLSHCELPFWYCRSTSLSTFVFTGLNGKLVKWMAFGIAVISSKELLLQPEDRWSQVRKATAIKSQGMYFFVFFRTIKFPQISLPLKSTPWFKPSIASCTVQMLTMIQLWQRWSRRSVYAASCNAIACHYLTGNVSANLPLLNPVFRRMKGKDEPLTRSVKRTKPAVHSTISDLMTCMDTSVLIA